MRPKLKRGLRQWAIQSNQLHRVPDPQKAIEQTDAIFIGGGNTFRLLKALQDLDLLDADWSAK